MAMTISNTINNAKVNGNSEIIGGFVSSFESNKNMTMTISNSTNNGNVIGVNYVGGLTGCFLSNTNMTITLLNNFCNGSVTGSGKNAGGFVGYISSNTNMTMTISNSTNNGTVAGSGEYVGGFVGCIRSLKTKSISLFITNSANKGNVSAKNGMACGVFCVDSNNNYDVKSAFTNSINKGSVDARTNAYGITNSITKARNVVSMGDVTGSSGSFTFWKSSNDAGLFFGLKSKCKNCTTNATLFENNISTWFYEVVESHELVHDLLNNEAVNQHFGMVWTSELDLVDKVNLTVNVSGLLETSFVVESGTPLNKVDGLSPLLGGENHCVANANSVRRSVDYSSYLVSRNMSMVMGNCSSVSLGSPVIKSVLLLVGDELGQLTPLYGFSFYGFILVDKNTNTIIGNSTVVEDGMVIALCHNVTVESSESNIMDSFPVEDKTHLSDNENVKRYTNDYRFINKTTRELIQFSTEATGDMWLLLAHQVTTSGFKSSAFFVERGQQLDTNKGLAEYFDETMFFNVTDAKNGTTYGGSTRVYKNMDVVIIDLCGTFNEDECITTSGFKNSTFFVESGQQLDTKGLQNTLMKPCFSM